MPFISKPYNEDAVVITKRHCLTSISALWNRGVFQMLIIALNSLIDKEKQLYLYPVSTS